MKTLINKDVISELKPCKDRFHNYLEHYKDKAFTKAQFMGLKHVSQEDKLWVAFRSMPKQNIALAAADIAESVLHIFEAAYPTDLRPRQAIAAARSGDIRAAANAAYTASAAAAYTASAASAAYASADAATASAYAAYVASANAAAYAATASADAAYAAYTAYTASAYASYTSAYAASACTYAAYASAEDRAKQEKLIRKIVLKYWKEVL